MRPKVCKFKIVCNQYEQGDCFEDSICGFKEEYEDGRR